VDELADLYLKDMAKRNAPEHNVDVTRGVLKRLEATKSVLADVTPDDMRHWIDTRRKANGDPVAPTTLRTNISQIHAFYAWAFEEGHVSANPAAGMTRPQTKDRVPPEVTIEDLDRAIRWSSGEINCWIVLAAYQGLTPQEVALVSIGDFDFTSLAPTLIVRRRGERDRSVPVHQRSLSALMSLPMPEIGRVFPDATGPLVSRAINDYLKSMDMDIRANDLRSWLNSPGYWKNELSQGSAAILSNEAQTSNENGGDEAIAKRKAPTISTKNIPDDFHDFIPRIENLCDLDLVIPQKLEDRVRNSASGLIVSESLLGECAAALISGHVVLQGPPGTGKSTLARALAEAFNVDLLSVTAHEDWSTFEVIGRQELRVNDEGREEIVPVNGHFTEAVIRCAGTMRRHLDNPKLHSATWLLIDELNRSHPDRAFGELFSVIGSDERVNIRLGYQRYGNDELVVPRRFRIIATLNSIDKQFVNSLSQGLRRRFTFLTVDVPPPRDPVEQWVGGESLASKEFSVVQTLASKRASKSTGLPRSGIEEFLTNHQIFSLMVALFEDIVERVRYASQEDVDPHVPIGTASIIDTVELFLIRSAQTGFDLAKAPSVLDWAASVKLVPLFDAGGINRSRLDHLASSLSPPFSNLTRRAMETISSDGQYYAR